VSVERVFENQKERTPSSRAPTDLTSVEHVFENQNEVRPTRLAPTDLASVERMFGQPDATVNRRTDEAFTRPLHKL
jgi:hypothetical protein